LRYPTPSRAQKLALAFVDRGAVSLSLGRPPDAVKLNATIPPHPHINIKNLDYEFPQKLLDNGQPRTARLLRYPTPSRAQKLALAFVDRGAVSLSLGRPPDAVKLNAAIPPHPLIKMLWLPKDTDYILI